ncbi:MAG: UDP-N-acetylmuramoyl-L-alanine--D-glutamate ligase [Parachlamydiaceae bacterium]
MEKNVLILGLGISGQSAARFLLRRGFSVVGVDRNADLPQLNEAVRFLCQAGMTFVSEKDFQDISRFNLVIVSPGIPPTHPYYQQAIAQGIEVIGEVELACREMNRPCLAITGTNGKTTVTLLTEHVLNSSGIKAKALGNVGISLTDGLDEAIECKTDVFVVELSSFQLETLSCRFADAAVILNITPDHLDRYSSMEDYAVAKIKISDCLLSGRKLFVEERCYQEFRKLFGNIVVLTYGYHPDCYVWTDTHHVYRQGIKCFTLPAPYQGKHSHDVENILASYALCSEASITAEDFLNALSSFKKPAHRIEFVRMINGVTYINDSKGTNIDAVIRAVDSLSLENGQIILIAGGVDKGFPYTSWVQAFNGKVKSVCALGQSKERILCDLGQHLPVELFTTLQEAVAYAAGMAKRGDTILLSPGCSSYDMFKDYAHRGSEFQRLVNAL